MDALKENYDRVLLVVCAVIALALGVMLTLKAQSLPDQFARSEATQRADFGESQVDVATSATTHLDSKPAWVSSTMPGVPQKPLPLMKSPPIWVKNGEEIDLLDPSSPQICSGIDNAYVTAHDLDAGRSDLKELDEDGDGFNTLEEFTNGKTDPNDDKSHPPFTLKLSLADVKVDNYTHEFRTEGGATGGHGIRETLELFQGGPARPRRTHFLAIGDTFGFHPGHENRYKLVDFVKKEIPDPAGGIPKNESELTIEDTQTDEQFKLKYREPRVTPTSYAVFNYSLPGFEGDIEGFFKVGDTFQLPNDPDNTYEVVELKGTVADGAKVRKKGAAGETPVDISIPPKA